MLRWCLVCVICNCKTFDSFIFKLCIMIVEDAHLPFCAHLINVFSFLTGVKLRHFFHPKCLLCLVCVSCNSNNFHFFTFKLCIMIVHTLKMCTIYIVHISRISVYLFIYFFWGGGGGLELRHFLPSKCLDCVWFV